MQLRHFILSLALILFAASAAAQQDSGARVSSKNKFKSFFPPPVNQSSPEFRLVDSIYRKASLFTYGLDRMVFFDAFKGYQYLLAAGKLSNPNILTIADYGQSAKNRRLYVIDLQNAKVLYNTFVSHGKNSGTEYASDFSNSQHSNKSSPGFMVTAETYVGVAGYSLRLDGVEQGINDQVRARNVVMHGSKFVNYERIYEKGTIGNSLGCPAIPMSDHKQVIDAIKGGSCFFIYSNEPHYKRTSAILNSDFRWPALRQIVPVQGGAPSTAGSHTPVQSK